MSKTINALGQYYQLKICLFLEQVVYNTVLVCGSFPLYSCMKIIVYKMLY